MNSSLYLRNRLLYEKKIASSLTKGVNAVIKDLGQTTGTIENGIERAGMHLVFLLTIKMSAKN
ncbi:hypothetical protein [Rouxiella sp. Mn2063]|uniref:hypothetical protein n=1 Tax=Rouxiella sp. Mn2063 TaxID=3395262 RepID=UPI003BCBCE01